MRPLRFLATVALITAAIWFTAMVIIAALLTCARTATSADELSGVCCAAMLIASLAWLSRLQRWRG